MNEQEVTKSHEATSVLEQTITSMELSRKCIHPIHYHSFQQVSFLISGPMRTCAGCEHRLRTVLGTGGSDQVVRCLACGFYAHRACARNEETSWALKCPVNGPLIFSEQGDDETFNSSSSIESNTHMSCPADSGTEIESTQLEQPNKMASVDEIDERDELSKHEQENTWMSESMFPSISLLSSFRNLLALRDSQVTETTDEETKGEQFDSSQKSFVWTNDGPPQHWASSNSMKSVINEPEDQVMLVTPGVDSLALPSQHDETTSMTSIGESTFFAVARALQENILCHFQTSKLDYVVHVQGDEVAEPLMSTDEDCNDNRLNEGEVKRWITRALIKDNTASVLSPSDMQQKVVDDSKKEVEALLSEVEPPKATNTILRLANDTYEAAKTSTSLRKKIGYASVAGGIAGGVAGLFVAGPAGAVLGAKCGQTVGFIGVALEGSYSIGIFVAGVAGAAAAGFTVAQKLQDHHKKRILTIGEKDINRKVLLVRPNVWIDPEWDAITANVKRSTPVPTTSFLQMLSSSPEKQAQLERQERSKRDEDIVYTDEFEIPTEDKVLLLVSRSLNCKYTVPGHVYRSLIHEHRSRSDKRDSRGKRKDTAKSSDESISNESRRNLDLYEGVVRARRQDTHAVIKHVTATLLEVRPGFAHSTRITEMSAAAVETLVFGELYDSVFAEIIQEMKPTDDALTSKFNAFEPDHLASDISKDAIKALNQIPEAHSVVDKLQYCVVFLERIADHFDGGNLSADSLLKMACQHICVAKVPNLNAEIAFVEEFARDDQLLRGKEGYALVTLQASLHFLNASNDFAKDIFLEDHI